MNTSVDVSGKRVVVALTGRVDSAVAAFLLKKQGYDVIGLAMVVASEDLTASQELLPRCYINNLEKVKELCEKIKIPFYATDIKNEYDYEVIDRHVENKLTGLANSSCFQCTSLRMRTLFEKMKTLKAHHIATGHYCKVYENLNSNEFFIHSNNTVDVDQSIMLAGLPQEILKHLILPLGELRAEEVEKIAKSFNLDTTKRIEQSGFCLKGEAADKVLKNKVPKSLVHEGAFVNIESESIYGDHAGVMNYFIGQKENVTTSGIKIDKNLEIVKYDYKKKFLYIGESTHLRFKGTQVTDLRTSSRLDRRKPLHCFVKFKYSADYIEAHIYFKNNNTAYLSFVEEVYPLLKSEQIVIYDSNKRNSKVIGLATVNCRGENKSLDRLYSYKSKGEIQQDEEEDTTARSRDFRF